MNQGSWRYVGIAALLGSVAYGILALAWPGAMQGFWWRLSGRRPRPWTEVALDNVGQTLNQAQRTLDEQRHLATHRFQAMRPGVLASLVAMQATALGLGQAIGAWANWTSRRVQREVWPSVQHTVQRDILPTVRTTQRRVEREVWPGVQRSVQKDILPTVQQTVRRVRGEQPFFRRTMWSIGSTLGSIGQGVGLIVGAIVAVPVAIITTLGLIWRTATSSLWGFIRTVTWITALGAIALYIYAPERRQREEMYRTFEEWYGSASGAVGWFRDNVTSLGERLPWVA